MLFDQIFRDDPVAAPKLRVAKDAVLQQLRIVVVMVHKNTGRRRKAVVVFRRPEEVVVEAGFRGQRQHGRDVVCRAQFECIVLCFIGWRQLGVDDAQIRVLLVAEIGIHIGHQVMKIRRHVIRQRISIRHAIGARIIERAHFAALAEIGPHAAEQCTAIDDLRHRLAVHREGAVVGGAKLLAAAQAIIVFREMFPDEIGLNIRRRFPADGQTARPQIAAVYPLIGLFVETVTLALGPFAGGADIEVIIRDRNIDHAFETL